MTAPEERSAVAPLKAGDVVHHRALDEDWVVAAVSEDRTHFYACGWPETLARVEDVDVIDVATPGRSRALLDEVASSRDDNGHHTGRSLAAARNLAALDAGPGART